MKQTLFLMMGYPGSGKTTTARILAKLTGAVHLASDEVRLELFPEPTFSQAEHLAVYTELDKRAKAVLAEGKSVIYDANLNRRVHREEKYQLAKDANVRVLSVWLQAPRDLARTRAVIRGHRHLVPQDETFESMFDRVASTLEEPDANEPVVILNGNHITEGSVRTILLHQS